jgi:hypothetical protein
MRGEEERIAESWSCQRRPGCMRHDERGSDVLVLCAPPGLLMPSARIAGHRCCQLPQRLD